MFRGGVVVVVVVVQCVNRCCGQGLREVVCPLAICVTFWDR